MSTNEFDLVTIGAGSAAFAAAIRASSLGARVALVERGTVGGTCVNVGCVPSKYLLAASHAYSDAGANLFPGVDTAQDGMDLAKLVSGKDALVSELRSEKYLDLVGDYGFEIIRGQARFASEDRIEVDGRTLRSGSYVIATGATPWVPPIPGLSEAGFLTSTSAMELDRLPASLVVVGGNYVGLELAQLFSGLGSAVTVVEALDRIAPAEEPEISAAMASILADEGIEIVTSSNVIRAEAGAPKAIVAETPAGERRFEAEEILVATGRRPVLEGLGLDRAGIDRDPRGALVLDDRLRTTNPRVFAAGDASGAPQFVYVAAAQGALVADNALSGADRAMDYTALPRVTFTRPNIASVGLTDAQAIAAGHACSCRVVELRHVPRARVSLDTRGLFKIVADAHTGRVLGVHVLAESAGEVILAGVYAVKFGLTVDDLAETWAPYLTMAEGLRLTAQSFTRDIEKLSCCSA
jgi:mercuric reductase